MSLLLNVIFATHARSTHHKLALDALKHLQGPNMGRWTDTMLRHHAAYLEGAKAPDDDFKDFRNHVLHVRENFWGGAVDSVHHWYGQFVDHLRGEEWKDAAYAAGVLSHYYSDPLMPFHTGQSEAEGAVHRAAEWSVTKSYESLRTMIDEQLGGYPDVEIPDSDDWLGEMVRNGARFSNQYYELVIDHYNLAVAVRNPSSGFDEVARTAIAKCLAHATIGLARILERAFDESLAAPPDVILTLPALVATINIPYQQIIRRLADSKDRKEVEAIFREVQDNGKAIHSLPESERLVRQFHATEVLKVPLSVLDREKPRPAGTRYISPATSTSPVSVPTMQVDPPTPASADAPQTHTVMTTSPIRPPSILKADSMNPEPRAEGSASPAEQPDAAQSRSAKMVDGESSFWEPMAAMELQLTPDVGDVGANCSPSGTEQPADVETPELPKTSPHRFHLRIDGPLVDAPSIGPKTAARFHQLGLKTISDLLEADADELAVRLSTRHITADVIRDWQAQSLLMIDVPGLRGPMAQLLVSAEIRDHASLRAADAESLLEHLLKIAQTSYGRSILRDGLPPSLSDVETWITAAANAEENNSSLV